MFTARHSLGEIDRVGKQTRRLPVFGRPVRGIDMVKDPGNRPRIRLPEALPQTLPAQSKQTIAGIPGAPASLLHTLRQAFLRGLIAQTQGDTR
jgi:hypothetical protein